MSLALFSFKEQRSILGTSRHRDTHRCGTHIPAEPFVSHRNWRVSGYCRLSRCSTRTAQGGYKSLRTVRWPSTRGRLCGWSKRIGEQCHEIHLVRRWRNFTINISHLLKTNWLKSVSGFVNKSVYSLHYRDNWYVNQSISDRSIINHSIKHHSNKCQSWIFEQLSFSHKITFLNLDEITMIFNW